VASIRCSRGLFIYCTVVVPRMLLSHWYTMPTPLADGASNASRSASAAATFWLALAKAGGWRSAHSFIMA
jgi:hypothetical protein